MVLAATVIFAVGLIDDLREVSAPAKVAGMVLAGIVLVRFGVSILFLRIPFFDLVLLSPDLSALITVLWVVGMANAINLIDGLDGLAAGIVAIAVGLVLPLQRAAGRRRGASARTTSARSSPSSPSASAWASCPTTSTRPGSSWATAGRCCSAC